MRARALALAAGVLLALGVGAPEAAAVTAWIDEHQPHWLYGTARYRAHLYHDAGRHENERYRNQVELDLRADPEITRELWVEAWVRVIYDDAGLSAGALRERHRRRNIVDVREAYLAHERLGGRVELRLGKQIFGWGKAELFSPTDLLSPRDYTDLLDSEKLGIPAVMARYLLPGHVTLELVWAPWLFIPSRFPPPGARYDLVPPELPARMLARDLPPLRFTSSQFAARVAGTLRALELDWELTAYAGRDREPNLRPGLDPAAGAPTLEPFHKVQHVAGAAVERVIDRFTLRADGAYFIHSRRDEDSYVQYAAGGVYRHTGLVDASDELSVALEYLGLVRTARARTDVVASLRARVFRSAILAGLRYSLWGGELTAEASAIWLTHGPDSAWVQLEAGYRVLQDIRVILGGDILIGPPGGFFGQFADDDRLSVTIEASF